MCDGTGTTEWPSKMTSANGETKNELSSSILPFRLPGFGIDPKSEKTIFLIVIALAVYSVVRNLMQAAGKPLWFDEILTLVVSRQPDFAAIWNALKSGVDGNPPLFYLIERVASHLSSNEMLAFRLVSALAFACTFICLYIFVQRRSGARIALICAVLIFVTPLNNKYSLEARPYSLLVACLALALVCYQRLPAARWTVGLFLSLSLAESLHYYAVLACLPFFLAEIAHVFATSRIRYWVWLSLFGSLIPALISAPLLVNLRHAYADHIWARPEFMLIPMSYGGYFRLNALWGLAVAIISSLVVIAAWARGRTQRELTGGIEIAPASEHALVLGFVALPVVGVVAARIAHGGAADRYYLPAILGIAIAFGYVLSKITPAGFQLVAALILIAVAFQEADVMRAVLRNPHGIDSRAPVLSLLSDAIARNDLPLVLSDAGEYVELSHVAQQSLNRRMTTLVDPPSAVVYAGTDTVDRLVIELKSYVPLQVYDFKSFAAVHPDFLLYSDGTPFDWWPSRLIHDGAQVELVEKQGGGTLYRVALNREAAAIHRENALGR
jgi:Dolichyl-phosphate-mannose-protein mannosyltransferase